MRLNLRRISFFEVTALPEFKEKPKMGAPKTKRWDMLLPKQAARIMKEKYLQELDQHPEGPENTETQAVGQVEEAGRWAMDEMTAHTPHPHCQEKRTIKEKPPASGERREKTVPKQERQKKWSANTLKRHRASVASETVVENATPTGPRHSQEWRRTELARRQFTQERKVRRQSALNDQRRSVSAFHQPPVAGAPRSASAPASNAGRRAALPKERQQAKMTAAPKRSAQMPAKKVPPGPKVRDLPGKVAVRKSFSTVSQHMRSQAAVQARKAAKNTAVVFKRAIQAVAKAAAAVVGAVSGMVGGAVVLVALIVIIIIAAVANSPFGLFFAEERNAPDTVSVSEAVAQVNMAYNARLEELQAGDYDSIAVEGQAPDWTDVLAVFASKTAGADDGVDVATMDDDRVARLTAVFWDMTEVTSWVETIDHPGDGDGDDGWTEYILHITITPKTPDDMRTAYAFTSYQNTAMDELLADRAALAALAGSLTITNADAQAVLNGLPDDLSPERRAVVETALKLYGKVNYFWGGKSLVLGWDSRWGQLRQVWADGSPTTGTYRPYGLDCSGYIDWVFYNMSGGEYIIGHGGGAHAQHTYCTEITWNEARPGDLVFYPEDEHVGIVCGRDEDGGLLVIHCASSANNVVITGTSGFVSVARPDFYNE